jgi:hypothetical protein
LVENEEESKVVIVIDGPNVGMSHSSNKWPASATGIVTAVTYYSDAGYEVYAFVPRHYLSDNAGKKGVDEPSILRKLRDQGTVVSVPSQDHDDDYWLQFAWQQGAYAVTNDRMKDHVVKYPDGEEGFYKWRDNKVISYTFAGDIYLPNPSFELPKPTVHQVKELTKSKPKTDSKGSKKTTPKQAKKQAGKKVAKQPQKSKKSTTSPTVRQARKAFREVVRQRLAGGSVNCGLLASEITALVNEKLGQDCANRKELMGVMNVSTSLSFHDQLIQVMGSELKVELVNGQPVDVHLQDSANSKPSTSKAEPSAKQAKPKAQKSVANKPGKVVDNKSGKGKRMHLEEFKQTLTENDLDKLKISIYQLPLKIEQAIPFLNTIEYPVNYADLGNRYKAKFGARISSLFKNMDNLILFINFRLEFNVSDLIRDGDIILRQSATSKSPSKKPASGGLIAWFKSLFS